MVALIARRSKYDFWIPGEILGLEKKSEQKSFFFDLEKKNFFVNTLKRSQLSQFLE